MDEYHINYTLFNISLGSERCYLTYYRTQNQNQFVTCRSIVWTITPTDPPNIFTNFFWKKYFERRIWKKVFIYAYYHMS